MQERVLLVAFALVLLAISVFLIGRKRSSKPTFGSRVAPEVGPVDELVKLRELDARVSGLMARVRRTLEAEGLPTSQLDILANGLVQLRRIQDLLQPLIATAHQQSLSDATTTKTAVKHSAKLAQQIELVAHEVESTLKEIREVQAAKFLDELGSD